MTRAHKAAALGRILDVEEPAAAIVFCRTRTEVDELTETLNGRGYRAEALHGGMNQEGRDRVMGRLRNGTAELLIATDVAARGLDVDILTHVVNYDVPSAPDAYVHRIGRVGRAGRAGVAITLAEPRELRLLQQHRAGDEAPDPRRAGAVGRRAAGPPARRRPPTPCARRWAPTTCDRFAADARRADAESATSATSPAPPSRSPTRPARPRPTRSRSRRSCRAARRARPRHGRQGPLARPRQRRPPATATRRASPAAASRRRRARRPGCSSTSAASDRIRPGDLVGAIANESDLTGKDIGPINVTETFSTVDVPAAAADAVIDAIKQTTIRGKRASHPPRPRPGPTAPSVRVRSLASVQSSTDPRRSGAIRDARRSRRSSRQKPSLAEPLAPLLVVAGMLAVMWAVEIIDLLPGTTSTRWGIRPRTTSGLIGIPLAPFLHSGLSHLIANTIPFVVLGAFIAIGDVKRFVEVTVIDRPRQRARHVAVRRTGHDPPRRQRPRVRVPDVPRGARLLRRQAAVDPRRHRRLAVLRRDPVGPAAAPGHLLHRPPVRRRRRRPRRLCVHGASPATPIYPARATDGAGHTGPMTRDPALGP